MKTRWRSEAILLEGLSALAILLLILSPSVLAQRDHIVPTPPMGWNSWNHFAGKIDAATIRAQADAMVQSGMRAAGYVYVNIDDTWEGTRDAKGFIHPNAKFPDMKQLSDYVHARDLKLGIYSSPGPKTCAGYEGSYGYEEQDAQTYAEWGVDYLKYDLCSLRDIMAAAKSSQQAHEIMVRAYVKMRDSLHETGRPIVYSFCQYGNDAVWRWAPGAGANLWRTTGDIEDNYSRMAEIGFGQAGLSKFSGPGHWNDPDMLEVGNGGMSNDEYQTHMSLWALLAAPLIAGNDLTHMSRETLALLTNKDVIAIDQDRAAKQAERFSAEGPLEIWVRPLADGSKAVGLFNRHPEALEMAIDFREIGFAGVVRVRNVWTSSDFDPTPIMYRARVPGHGAVLLRVFPRKPSS
jgi:alpha-galactosidase